MSIFTLFFKISVIAYESEFHRVTFCLAILMFLSVSAIACENFDLETIFLEFNYQVCCFIIEIKPVFKD